MTTSISTNEFLNHAGFHPVIKQWFTNKFTAPTDPQRNGWPAIAAGHDTLIAAPTGSGKTLTSFLVCIDRLLRERLEKADISSSPEGESQGVRVVYISPLKSLSNDIKRNLEGPLAEIDAIALSTTGRASGIRTLIRTGDTPSAQRQRMLKHPPDILITTPESLFLLLTSEKSRQILRNVETVIVDEIHALARDKRGSHLALTLERLDVLCGKRAQRIGLSATQKPIADIAAFLTGVDAHGMTRPCAVIDSGHRRMIDLDIEVPPSELSAVCSNEQWDEIYLRIKDLISEHRSTLIFVNTRKMAERIAFNLSLQLGEDAVTSHHGSLSRDKRIDAEERLKNGSLKAIVATASLELGIDIGYIDLVCQIGSPRSIATFLQRIGRSGHAIGAVPKGRIFALTRDELLESMALVHAIHQGTLDKLMVPQCPLDILAQQIVAEAACREIAEDDLAAMIKRAWPFRSLQAKDFHDTITMLADGYADGRRNTAWLYRDGMNQRIKARKGARIAAVTSGGAIPEMGDFRVVNEDDGSFVGTINEDFALESSRGDIFLLGNTSWQIRQVSGAEVSVRDMNGAPPTIPFWLGEAPGRTVELSAAVASLREALSERITPPEDESDPLFQQDQVKMIAAMEPNNYKRAFQWLKEHITQNAWAAWQAVHYIGIQKAALGIIPTQKKIVFERFFDDTGGMQLVIHAPFGMRINRGFGLALRKRFCRSFDFELQASADDNGVVLSLGPQNSFPIESLFKMLNVDNVQPILEQAILAVPLFQIRWRWNLNRSLAVLRNKTGKRVPPALQRWRSDDLMTAIFPAQTQCKEHVTGDIEIPDHPLVNQTMHDCLHEAIDLEGLTEVIRGMQSGEIELLARDTREPSPFSYQLLNAYPYAFLDDAPLEERRARAVATRRNLSFDALSDLCTLDKGAADLVANEAWPDARNEDEMHDVLMALTVLPDDSERLDPIWSIMLEGLAAKKRAARLHTATGVAWFPAEHLPLIRAAYGTDIKITPNITIPAHLERSYEQEGARAKIIQSYMAHIAVTSAVHLSKVLGFSLGAVEATLPAIEASGAVLRGHFTSAEELQWCDRRLLARIHRLTLEGLRRQIKPVAPHDMLNFLLHWQHVAKGTRLIGKEGLLEVIDQLQGFDAAAGSWENEIIPARMESYLPSWLDELSHGGIVTWGRLRPPMNTSVNGDQAPVPSSTTMTRSAPLALMIREDVNWLLPEQRSDAKPLMRGSAQTVYEALTTYGAMFPYELKMRASLPETHIEEALGELAHLGLIHADGFGAIRPYINKQRRRHPTFRGLSRKYMTRPSITEGSGRWSLFPPPMPRPEHELVLERWARLLLKRYGIIFRDLLIREDAAPSFYELAPTLRRMEARGEIRGGRFVAGPFGEQFALPEAVTQLRDLRTKQADSKQSFCVISASDPLNLSGILTDGEKIPANRQTLIALSCSAGGGTVLATSDGDETEFLVPLEPELRTEIERALTLNGVFRNRLSSIEQTIGS